MGLQWEYEPEGFDLDGINYLPDFRVQTGDLIYWYEIKPLGVTDDGKFRRFRDLITADAENGKRFGVEARLLSGDPVDVFTGTQPCPRCGLHVDGKPNKTCNGTWSFYCFDCDMATVSGGGNPPETGWAGISYTPHKGDIEIQKVDYFQMMHMISSACIAARSARFEHGECGAT